MVTEDVHSPMVKRWLPNRGSGGSSSGPWSTCPLKCHGSLGRAKRSRPGAQDSAERSLSKNILEGGKLGRGSSHGAKAQKVRLLACRCAISHMGEHSTMEIS